jgi:lipoate-protein ligase A
VTEADIPVAGGKLVGSAQARSRGAVLQHGSILIAADRGDWRRLFGGDDRLAPLADLLEQPPDADSLAERILSRLSTVWGVDFRLGSLTCSERTYAEEARPRFRLEVGPGSAELMAGSAEGRGRAREQE